MNSKKLSRKKFLKSAAGLLAVPFGFLWIKSVKENNKIRGAKRININITTLQNGVNFLGPVIAEKSGNSITVFSSKCTHLGCRINKLEGDLFVCPCHGSKYNLNGIVVSGPADKPLNKLELKFDKKSGGYFVNV